MNGHRIFNIPFWGETGVLSAHHSMLRRTKLTRPLCGITYASTGPIWSTLCGPVRNVFQGTATRIAIPTHPCSMSDKLTFLSCLGVCVLLPAVLKYGCPTCLPACRWISYPVQFLTVNPSSGFIHKLMLMAQEHYQPKQKRKGRNYIRLHRRRVTHRNAHTHITQENTNDSWITTLFSTTEQRPNLSL